jgi:hypothetical protein
VTLQLLQFLMLYPCFWCHVKKWCSLFGIVGVTDKCLEVLSRFCSNTVTTLDVNGCIGIKVLVVCYCEQPQSFSWSLCIYKLIVRIITNELVPHRCYCISRRGGLSKTITKLEHTHQIKKKKKGSQQHCRDTSFRLKLENMWQTPPPPVLSQTYKQDKQHEYW